MFFMELGRPTVLYIHFEQFDTVLAIECEGKVE